MKTSTCIRLSVWLAALAVAPSVVGAQDRPAPTPPPPPTMTVGPQIQRIETASAVSKELLTAITSVQELPDGRVLVNDGTRRRLLLMDTTLTNVEIVLDSLSEISNTYGTRAGALVPFRGDTTLFIDPASLAIVVIDPAGRIARIRSVWRAEHVSYFASNTGLYGFPGVDAQGRIVYRIPARPAPPAVRPPAGVPYYPPQPDSAFVVAADLDTRKIDTLGVVRIPKQDMLAHRTTEGYFSFYSIVNPLPRTDHWAVLPDGAIAFIRALDYRIEYLNPDRSLTSSSKLPYEWQQLTDERKQHIADSTLVAQQRTAAHSYAMSIIRWTNTYAKPYPPGFKVPEGFSLQSYPGLPKDWILPPGVTFPNNYIYACAPGEQPAAAPGPSAVPIAGAPGAPAMPSCYPYLAPPNMGNTPPPPSLRPVGVVPADELPDYRPPFPIGALGAVRADMEGNLWIRTVPPRPIPGGLVYDIVSRQGELVNRYQLPPGYSLVGFGRGKIVYLSMRDATGLHLARVRLR